jgi:hypothetical protein
MYITECLRLSGEGKYLTTPYLDLIKPRKRDTRSVDEVISDVAKRAGLKEKR